MSSCALGEVCSACTHLQYIKCSYIPFHSGTFPEPIGDSGIACMANEDNCLPGADLGGGGGGGGASGAGAPPFCFFTALFSSLLTCCRYVATPDLASSARNTVRCGRCLKPNGLGTRPRSSITLRVRTYYVRERIRNLSKEEAHGGPGTCNPRTSGTCSAKREGATRAHPEK